jgi:hypothetical protein
MDSDLQALAGAAERGDLCAPVRLLVGSSFVAGQPGTTAEFADAMKGRLEEDLWREYQRGREDADAESAYLAHLDRLRPTWNSIMGEPADRLGAGALTLIGA